MGASAAFAACLLLLQDPAELFQKAPPAVDEALRARISKFFQAHVDGKLRGAVEVVAEDSQERFFAANKPRCYSFEIVKIDYSENFTRATAVVTCEMDHPSPGLGGVKVKVPRTTLWKLADGQWWYYIDPDQGYQTPFGVMRPGPGKGGPPPEIAPGTTPAPPPGLNTEALFSWIKPSKRELSLHSSKAGSDELTLANQGGDTATLIMQYSPMPGLEIKLDRTQVNKGESARLTAKWEPGEIPAPPTIPVSILVQPTGQGIVVLVTFTKQ